MPTAITMEIGKVTLKAELNDSESAKSFLGLLPREISLSRSEWTSRTDSPVARTEAQRS